MFHPYLKNGTKVRPIQTAETRRISQDIKSNIDERITKILDSKLAAESQSQATGQAFSQMLMQKLAEGIQGSGGKPPETS